MKNVNIRFIAILLLLILAVSIFTPNIAFATEDKDKDPKTGTDKSLFDVTVDADGNLTITGEGFDGEVEDSWKQIIFKLRYFITGIVGVSVILCVGILIVQFTKLASVGDNPNKRKEITTGIGWTFVAVALIGSVTTVVAIAYRFF